MDVNVLQYNGLNFVYTKTKADTVHFGLVPLQSISLPSVGRSQPLVVILPRHLPPGYLVDQCVCLFSTQSINGPWDQPISFWFIWDFAQEVVKCFFEINLVSSEIPHILWQTVPQLWSSHLEALSPQVLRLGFPSVWSDFTHAPPPFLTTRPLYSTIGRHSMDYFPHIDYLIPLQPPLL